MIKALLFDIDGTLMDTSDAIIAAMNVAMEEDHEDPLKWNELKPLIGRDIASQMAALRGIYGASVESIRETYYRTFVKLLKEGVRLYPGVKETLEMLHGYSVGTITTRRRKVAHLMLGLGRIDRHFTAIVGGDEVSRPKPHPDLVQRACKALRVTPSESVAIGDSPVDILAGRAAGAITVAAMYGYGKEKELIGSAPDKTIANFSELPEVLEDINR